MTGPAGTIVEGLTNPRGLALDRFPIRSREASVTLSAWRLTVGADEGAGTIALVELGPGAAAYRGDGIFLGWTQDRLAGAYAALRPSNEAAVAMDMPQLG